jgi:hypothetical protein
LEHLAVEIQELDNQEGMHQVVDSPVAAFLVAFDPVEGNNLVVDNNPVGHPLEGNLVGHKDHTLEDNQEGRRQVVDNPEAAFLVAALVDKQQVAFVDLELHQLALEVES